MSRFDRTPEDMDPFNDPANLEALREIAQEESVADYHKSANEVLAKMAGDTALKLMSNGHPMPPEMYKEVAHKAACVTLEVMRTLGLTQTMSHIDFTQALHSIEQEAKGEQS